MLYVKSCEEHNGLVNIDKCVYIKINREEHLGSCSIVFDEKVWIYYESKENFNRDIEMLMKTMHF